jgi:hypothetical protein
MTAYTKDTSNNRGNWNHLNIIQKIPEQHTGKHEIKELQKTAIFGTAAHISENTNAKVRNI